MKYRYFSDLHLERDASRVKRPCIADLWAPTEQPDDASTVLILAGDIWNGTRPLMFAGESWLAKLAARFKAVICVLGNHDYWGASVDTLPAKWRAKIQELQLANVTLLEIADGVEHGTLVIDGIRLIGGTLWTNLDRGSPLVVTKYNFEKGFDGRALWNDQNYIRAGHYSKFTASHWLRRHHASMANLREAILLGDEPVLFLGHHAQCMLSAAHRDNDPLSRFLYASDLSDFILDHPRIKTVIHGHTHEAMTYLMGDVPVQCNPRGYAPESLVKGFNLGGAGEL